MGKNMISHQKLKYYVDASHLLFLVIIPETSGHSNSSLISNPFNIFILHLM